MPEDRRDRIDARLGELEAGQAELRTDVRGLRVDVAELKGDVSRLESDVAELKADVSNLKSDVAELKVDVTSLKGDVARLDGRIDTLDRHMHVLHEDTIGRIAAISEEPLATKQEMNRGFAELKGLILQRIEPLEVAVRGLLHERGPGNP